MLILIPVFKRIETHHCIPFLYDLRRDEQVTPYYVRSEIFETGRFKIDKSVITFT